MGRHLIKWAKLNLIIWWPIYHTLGRYWLRKRNFPQLNNSFAMYAHTLVTSIKLSVRQNVWEISLTKNKWSLPGHGWFSRIHFLQDVSDISHNKCQFCPAKSLFTASLIPLLTLFIKWILWCNFRGLFYFPALFSRQPALGATDYRGCRGHVFDSRADVRRGDDMHGIILFNMVLFVKDLCSKVQLDPVVLLLVEFYPKLHRWLRKSSDDLGI